MGKVIGFLGAGNMGAALANGFVEAGLANGPEVAVFDIDLAKAEALAASLGGQPCRSIMEVMQKADTVILAVKPQNIDDLAPQVAPWVGPKHLFISILAGTTTAKLEPMLGNDPRVVRVMPNTPAMVGLGASGVARGKFATEEDLAFALQLFRSVGVAVAVEERQLDAVTGLSGSGPAYFYALIEAMIEAGVEVGLERQTATDLAVQTALGAGRLAMDSDDSPAELRAKVTSKGGTTEAGLKVLFEGGFAELVGNCVKAATERSIELGK